MGYSHIFEALTTTTATFIVLLILTRLLGKKQLSQLTFFNYVTGITIGSISANIVIFEGESLIQAISSLIWWCLLTYFIEVLVIKQPRARVVLDGEPSILIKKGRIQFKTLKKNRLDIDHLITLLREKDVFSLKVVEYAILEPNGQLTILKKFDQQDITKKDLNVDFEPQLFIPTQIIVSGMIVKKNLIEYNLSYDWLYEQLHNNGVDKVKDVLYAELQPNGSLYVDKKDDK